MMKMMMMMRWSRSSERRTIMFIVSEKIIER